MKNQKKPNLLTRIVPIALATTMSVSAISCAKPPVTPTPPTTQPTPTPTPPITINPVEEHARSLGLSWDIIDRIKVLGEDNVMDDNEKALVDFLSLYPDITIVKLAEDRRITLTERKFIDLAYKMYDKRMVEALVPRLNEDTIEALTYLSNLPDVTKKNILNFGFEGDVIPWLKFVSSELSDDWQKYVIDNKLTIQDYRLTELEKQFLKEPDKYKQKIFDYNLSEIQKLNPELALELMKLPDLKQIDIKDVEALEDIVTLVPYKSVGGISFESMFNEGIKEKRKYSTPLQALVWSLYDYEKEFLQKEHWGKVYLPGRPSELMRFVRYVWVISSESNDYRSDRWKNFDEVIDRLNSPALVYYYMSDNFSYYYPGAALYMRESAYKTFLTKSGDCGNQSNFATYALRKNGYEAENLFLRFRPDRSGHVVTLYKDNLFYYLDTTLRGHEGIFGPFESKEEAIRNLANTLRISTYQIVDFPLMP